MENTKIFPRDNTWKTFVYLLIFLHSLLHFVYLFIFYINLSNLFIYAGAILMSLSHEIIEIALPSWYRAWYFLNFGRNPSARKAEDKIYRKQPLWFNG